MINFIVNKMKLFGEMEIIEKIENETSVCFRKICSNEREDMVKVHNKK